MHRAAPRALMTVCVTVALVVPAIVVGGVTAPTAAAGASTACPDNETCLLTVRVSDPSDPACDYGCPAGDDVAVTATGTRSNIPGDYVPPQDYVVIYEVPTSGANCVGVVGTDNGCLEVQSCPIGQAVCSITLTWNWNPSTPGASTTHVFEAWAVDSQGNVPDYCSGKSWFQYATSYLYAYQGSAQVGTTARPIAGSPGAGIAEVATSVPLGTSLVVRTYAIDPPLFDSNFSTYQCTDDSFAPPGVPECVTQPGSYTYPNDQAFATPSTSGYPGCNSSTIPPPPGWGWPSPLTQNGPYRFVEPTSRFYISTQAVYITDPDSHDVPCVGESPSAPQIGVSNWLAVSWYCPPAVQSLQAYAGSGQATVDGSPFPHPLEAEVVNSCTGQGLPGSAVTFSVPDGAATFTGGSPSDTAVSGANGIAVSSALTAGEEPRTFVAVARDAGRSASYSLTDTCNPGWGTGLAVASGTPQTTTAGTPFAQPLVARVVDQCGGPLAGADVTFSVPPASASFDDGTTEVQSDPTTTGADGTATSAPVLAASGFVGTYTAGATAAFPGPFSPQGPVTYALTNTCNPAVPSAVSVLGGDDQETGEGQPFAPLSVTVLDQCGTGWAGGTVSFTGPSSLTVPAVVFGSPTGATAASSVTDADGVAVSPVPIADSVAGSLGVVAAPTAGSVPGVTFTLLVAPPNGTGTLILPTADERRVGVVPGVAERSRPCPGPGRCRWEAGGRSRSRRRAHRVDRRPSEATTNSHRPGGTT